jgi:hypothetical protein
MAAMEELEVNVHSIDIRKVKWTSNGHLTISALADRVHEATQKGGLYRG